MIDSTTSQIYFHEYLDAKAESFNVFRQRHEADGMEVQLISQNSKQT
jgi:hypothetical protein